MGVFAGFLLANRSDARTNLYDKRKRLATEGETFSRVFWHLETPSRGVGVVVLAVVEIGQWSRFAVPRVV